MSDKKRDDLYHKLYGHIKPDDDRVAVKSCPVCHKGCIIKPDEPDGSYNCSYCGASELHLTEGFFIPFQSRGTLCGGYHPIEKFKASDYTAGDTITYKTNRGTVITSTILFVDPDEDNNQILIKDPKGVQRLITNESNVANSYDALFSVNKLKYAGWWNYRLYLVNQAPKPTQ